MTKDIRPFFARLEAFYAELEELLLRFHPSPGTENLCGGCAICCTSPLKVQMSSLELLFIQDRTRDWHTLKRFVYFINRMGEGDAPAPCACPYHMKKELQCSIYRWRPLACRTYGYSPDQELEKGCRFREFPHRGARWEEAAQRFEDFAHLRQEFYEHLDDALNPLTSLDFLFKGLLALRADALDEAEEHFALAHAMAPDDPLAISFIESLGELRGRTPTTTRNREEHDDAD